MNLPNKLTVIRMCMVPCFVACFYLPFACADLIAACLFVAAFLTDIADGRYARKHEQITDFGKLMDPMADKLLMSSAFIMLAAFGKIHALVAVISIAREFVISAYRMIAVGKGNVIAASWMGKAKTLTQCVSLTLAILNNPIETYTGIPVDRILLWIGVAFAVASVVDYIAKNKIQMTMK